MYDMLSPVQKEKFFAKSGEVYEDHRRDEIILRHLKIGKFLTKYAYNNRDWKYSPWRFTFVLEKETGSLCMRIVSQDDKQSYLRVGPGRQ